MNKKIVFFIIAIVVIIAAVIGFTLYKNDNSDTNNVNLDENVSNNEIEKNDEEKNVTNMSNTKSENETEMGNKILVVYFSAQSHTKTVAEKIAQNLNADIFEIEPEESYTADDLNWNNNNSRVSKEHDDESLRNVKLKNTKIDNWEEYDTVLIGYPIWWGVAAWPVNNFVKDNDFTGKTVIPFCTSASSSLGNSGKLLEELAGTGNWLDGHRFSSSAADSDIKTFTDSIK